MSALGEKLRRLRKAQGLTQGELAEKAGVSISTIVRYETGKNSPKLELLEDIFKALEASVSLEEMNQYERECGKINLKAEMKSVIYHTIQKIEESENDTFMLNELSEGLEKLANAYRLMGFANDNENNSFLS